LRPAVRPQSPRGSDRCGLFDRIVILGHSRSSGLALFSQSVTGAPVIRFGLAAMLSLALSTPGRGADPETVGSTQFLMMSDLHFDPMADPKLVDRLSSAEPEEWPGIFESSDNNTPARYGADSNWALLHSALWQTKQTLTNPAFVVLPGDFLRTIFAASSTPLRQTTRMRPTGCSCAKRCSSWRYNSSRPSPMHRSFRY
jgi:hypothetical protein